ncbi:MAG: MazG nucleotide pyrophosphohydrolase domain-containing protein [Bacilli bacterium]
MKEGLLKIINNYGVLPQLKYFQSEVFELNEAIIKAENKFEPVQDIDHIAEEIADVLNMVEQFMYYYDIDIKDVIEIKHQKIHRQLERIANEKDNNNI